MRRRIRELMNANYDEIAFYKHITDKRANGKVCDYVNVDEAEVSRRVGHVVLEHSDSVIVWGGFTQCSRRPGKLSVYWKPNWIMHYQPTSQVWHPIWTHPEDCPPPTSSPGGAIVDNNLYILCGFSVASWDKRLPDTQSGMTLDAIRNANNEILKNEGIEHLLTMTPADAGLQYMENNTNDVYRLNLETKRWTKIVPSGNPPLKCDKLITWVYNGKVYIFGGYGPAPPQGTPPGTRWQVDESVDEVDVPRGWNNQLVTFDPDTNSWEWLESWGDVPGPRAAHAADVNSNGHYALVFGGRFGEDRTNDLYHLNLRTLKWTMLQPPTDDDIASDFNVPKGRSWHSMSHVFGNNFVMFGGYSSLEHTLGDCWKFRFNPRHPSRSCWSRMRHLESRERRIWHKSCVVDGTVMIVGGFGTKCRIGSKSVDHGQGVLRLPMAPRSLQSLALDATCLQVQQCRLNDQLKNIVLPEELIQDLSNRLPKLLYERGKTLVVRQK